MDNGNSFAVLQEGQRQAQKWVKVGDFIDGMKVVRIERSRVVVSDGREDIYLYAGSGMGTTVAVPAVTASPPSLLAEKKGVEQGALDAVLNREFEELQKSPYPVSESDRKGLVKEIDRVFLEGKMIPTSKVLSIDGGEEVVVGMKTPSDISSMGIQKEDILLHINGISLDSKDRWQEVLGVIEGAQLISYAFVRGNQIYSQLYEVR